jgi:hypothetical protein
VCSWVTLHSQGKTLEVLKGKELYEASTLVSFALLLIHYKITDNISW